jgi:uridine kinase
MTSKTMLSFDEACALIASLPLSAEMIAIDGLPLAGKSTLAERLAEALGFGLLRIDDFNLALSDWPADIAPGYPFPFVRVEAFRAAVRALRHEGACVYYPMDWDAGYVSPEPRLLFRDKPIVIEGVSVLDPALLDCYDLKLFVESDRESVMDAMIARDGEAHKANWLSMFLPSDDIYMATRPQARADLLIAGRGA